MLISDWSSDVCSSDLLAPFLDKQLVRIGGGFRVRPVEEAEIVANVVGEYRLEEGAQNVPMDSRRDGRILDQHCGGDIAEDEMAVTVAPVEMARGNFRSEEHTSEIQSLMRISYAVFCLKNKP